MAPSPSPRIRRTADAARRHIADAAAREFARHGYRGTTIAAIAAEAGMTDAGVLHHFRTKRELFTSVVELFTALQADRVGEMVAPGGRRALENLASWGRVMEERPDLLGLQVVLSAEAIDPSSDLHDYFVQRTDFVLALVEGLLVQAIDAGELRADTDVAFEAECMMAYLDGARLLWFTSGGRRSIAAGFETYMARLLERLSPT